MRLIDADALAMHMADWQLSACSDQCDTIEEAIDAATSAPTIDPVRHGRWMDMKGFWMCSECHKDTLNLFNYCPYCGAKMDGDAND